MIPHLAATSPPRKRFLREARAAAAIRHENVVQVYSVEEHPIPYLAMEFIDGETLQQRLEEHGPFDAAVVIEFAAQIAHGLSAAHAHGLIHRDIKPGNILIENTIPPKVRITDFGLARTADDASLTQSGLIAGTPLYMSPEQASGKEIDHRSDLFSLGSVIYLMCCGHAPFRAPTTVAVLRRVTDDTPRSLRSILDTIPESLQAIVTKLLEKNPHSRYQTALEVVGDLRDPDSVVTKPTTPAIPTTITVSANSTSRRARTLSLLAVVALSVVALFTMKVWKSSQSQQNTANEQPAATDSAETVSAPSSKNAEEAIGWGGWPSDAPAPAIFPFEYDKGSVIQESWARYLKIPTRYVDRFGIEFVLIPPGEFEMGSTPEEITEARQLVGSNGYWKMCFDAEYAKHRAVLSKPFYMAVKEVTQAQMLELCATRASTFAPDGSRASDAVGLDTGDFPADSVGEEILQTFLATINRVATSLTNAVATPETDNGPYYLPTETQWEFACRAGTVGPYWPDSSPDVARSVSWIGTACAGRPHAVGQLPANAFGLYDMHGNISEFVVANVVPNDERSGDVDPESKPNASKKLCYRGGSWNFTMAQARSGFRGLLVPEAKGFRTAQAGFRVALEIEYVKKHASLPAVPKQQDAGWAGWPSDAPLPAIAPFSSAQAKAYQENWSKYLSIPVRYTNSAGMEFVLVPPGEFDLGSTAAQISYAQVVSEKLGFAPMWLKENRPLRRVRLTQPFYLGATEVSQSAYESVMGTNPSYFSPTGPRREAIGEESSKELPVDHVEYRDAIVFCQKLSEREQRKPSYFTGSRLPVAIAGVGYRLPSDAEWEYACKAGTVTTHWAGDEDVKVLAVDWLQQISKGRTHKVGMLSANPFGFFDMHGNVSEWVEDCWRPNAFVMRTSVNPVCPFPESHQRTSRGGDYRFNPYQCPSASRFSNISVNSKDAYFGIRLVLPVDCSTFLNR